MSGDLPGLHVERTRGREAYLEAIKSAVEASAPSDEPFISWGYHETWHGLVQRADLDQISNERAPLSCGNGLPRNHCQFSRAAVDGFQHRNRRGARRGRLCHRQVFGKGPSGGPEARGGLSACTRTPDTGITAREGHRLAGRDHNHCGHGRWGLFRIRRGGRHTKDSLRHGRYPLPHHPGSGCY